MSDGPRDVSPRLVCSWNVGCEVLVGSIVKCPKIAFMKRRSGSIASFDTWLGSVVFNRSKATSCK